MSDSPETLPAIAAPPAVPATPDYMAPATLNEALALAKILADSSFVPKDFRGKTGDVFCAIQFGREVGLAPMQALQGIAVINGRPSVWGDAALALVEASGKLESIIEVLEGDGAAMVARCTAKRRGRGGLIERTFSMADATAAHLATKDGPWKSYPKRMLQMRARAFVLRDGFSDVLKGLAIREEAQDIEIEATTVSTGIATPRALPESEKKAEPEPEPRPEPESPARPSDTPSTDAMPDADGHARTLLVEADRTRLIQDAAARGIGFPALKAFLGARGCTTTAIPVAIVPELKAWITAGGPESWKPQA